jgi:hypothetical protein
MGAGGFDAVIGNPPYVRQGVLSEQRSYLQDHYRVYHGVADLYTYLVEKGLDLLKSTGLFGMIVSNKWLRAAYGRPLRKLLGNDVSVLQIVSFAGLPVFPKATVRTIILICSPSPNQRDSIRYLAPVSKEVFRTIRGGERLQEIVDQRSVELPVSGMSPDGWTLSDPRSQAVLQHVAEGATALRDYVGGKMYRGIVTGLNKAFVIDSATYNQLITEDPKSAEIIKPLVVGRDVRRYAINYRDRYLIWTYIGVPIDRYPAILEHLTQFQTQLEKRWDKGNFWWELRACDYYEKFEEPKIIYPDIATTCRFALDRDGHYGTNTTYFFPGDDLYLLGILNSALGQFCVTEVCAGLEGGGTTYLRFFGQYLEEFPVWTIDDDDPQDVARHDKMVALVECMLELHEKLAAASIPADKKLYQRQIEATDRGIDALVYELYGLTEEEIGIVEGD